MSSSPGDMALKLTVALVIAVVVVQTLAGVGAYLGQGSAAIKYPDGSPDVVGDNIDRIPETVKVRATTGRGVRLNGEQTVESPGPDGIDEGEWAACVTAKLDADQPTNGTFDVLAYNSSRILLQYDNGSWSAYYNNGTQDAIARVPDADPTDLTPVCARYSNTSGLQVAADGDYSAQVPLTASASPRNVSWNWTGVHDEARLFGNASSNATLNGYMTDPIEPRPEADRAARMMLDEGSGRTTYMFFLDQTASVGGTWAQGVPGPRKWLGMASAIERGDDYTLSSDPFRLTVVQGGYLQGAPVVHVSWDGSGPFAVDLLDVMLLLVALLALTVPASLVVNRLK